jgi:hypothetical protein
MRNNAVAFARAVGVYLLVVGIGVSFWYVTGIDDSTYSYLYGGGYQERVFLTFVLEWLQRAAWVLILAEIVSRLLRRRSSLFADKPKTLRRLP